MFGSAGLRDVDKRGLMGHVAGRLADKIVITAEDPRTESLDDIMAAIAEGVHCRRPARRGGFLAHWRPGRGDSLCRAIWRVRVTWSWPAAKATSSPCALARPSIPWDDRQAMRDALRRMSKD